MATVKIAGATYTQVPSIHVPDGSGGTSIFVDEEQIVTYYTGSSAPSANLGENGDIYLQTGG